jgi:hypothetical protein
MIPEEFREYEITINGKNIKLDLPIYHLAAKQDKIIILIDPEYNTKRWGQLPNLLCYNDKGTYLWTAELPTTDTGDCYYLFKIKNDYIEAYSWESFTCYISIETGKIFEKIFTK